MARSACCVQVLLSLLAVSVAQQEYCYNTDDAPSRDYATKTPYEDARGQGVQEESIPGCQAVHFYQLSRHGTRYTGDDTIIDMGERLPVLQEHLLGGAPHDLCEEDVAAIAAWEMRMLPEDDKELAETGWEEFRQMAGRYKARYPDLLDREYREEEFSFQHTDGSSNRTRDSARAFAEGLFGTHEGVNIIENDADDDWLLYYYKLCTKWIEEVEDQPIVEHEKFMAGEEMAGVIDDVTARLGMEPGSLSYEDIDDLYDMCRVEYGVYWDAPWCASFAKYDIKVLEYNEDLKYYWRESYGHELNYEMACPPIVDILNEWSQALDDEAGYEKVSAAGFTHSTTMNSFFARLGLFKDDDHLYADDFDLNDDREWRTTAHTPMASNIAFVLYECEDGDHRVKTFVNDFPTTLPGCPEGEDTCSYDQVVSLWQDWADNCDMAEICELED